MVGNMLTRMMLISGFLFLSFRVVLWVVSSLSSFLLLFTPSPCPVRSTSGVHPLIYHVDMDLATGI